MLNDNKFESISKVVIFLPLIILVGYLLLKPTPRNQMSVFDQEDTSQEISSSPMQQSSNTKLSLDLEGPYTCEYSKDSTTATIAVKKRNVFVSLFQENIPSRIIVKEDCIYKWKLGETKGDKMCSIGQYLTLVDMLSSMKLLNVESIFSMIGQVKPDISIAPSTLTELSDSCVKDEIDDKIFVIPSNIIFTEMESISPSPVIK